MFLCQRAPRKTGFNDALVQKLDDELCFPTFTLNDYKLILVRFYRFYFNGIIDSTKDSLIATVFDAISIAHLSKSKLWPDKHDHDPFYDLNKSTSEVIEDATTPSSLDNPVNIENDQKSGEKFKEKIIDIIQGIDPLIPSKSEEIELYRLSGFLALTLMRFAVKTKAQMANCFSKEEYRKTLISVAGWKAEYPFLPPCTKCLDICYIGLDKNNPPVSKMFIKLSSLFVKTMHAKKRRKERKNYICASVLTHTSGNGLGMIDLLKTARKATNLSWEEIMKKTTLNVTEESWRVIKEFFKSQLSPDNIQYAYEWARIIDHGYFRELSPKEHPFLASIFGGIIEKFQGKDIWLAIWAKNRTTPEIELAKAIGTVLYNEHRKNVNN